MMRRIVLSLVTGLAIVGVSAGVTLAMMLAWHLGAEGIATLVALIAGTSTVVFLLEVFR